MLKDALYQIISLSKTGSSIEAALELNINHPIFSGHFPGQPVLPGACMLQMVKEVLDTVLEKPIRLKVADQMKFLKMVDPFVDKIVNLKVTYVTHEGAVLVTAIMTAAEDVVFKMKGSFLFVNAINH